MKKVYGYIRVSTVKQGTGVSLQEQKEAIIRYAEKHDLIIVEWFEEKETAAKQGRTLFTRMMKLLQSGKASGVIIHKIDRSARNLKDWAALGDLIDQGIEVHFAHESLDLDTRGGRLAADIQAVIASDYIRNLRDEAKKGLYGRLKQGVYPFGAPIGYINNGRGKLKTVDPIKGPLVKKAFELYATEKYSLNMLTSTMNEMGLKNSEEKPLRVTTMSKILHNPFYVGVLKVKGKAFKGVHEQLIPTKLYNQVQNLLSGKTNSKPIKHQFLFRRFVKCYGCGYSLIGERQKGHVYYRCHSKECSTKGLREEVIEKVVLASIGKIQLHSLESTTLNEMMQEAQSHWAEDQKGVEESIIMQRGRLSQKLDRLADAYVEGIIDATLFETKKERLLIEQQGLNFQSRHLLSQKEMIFRRAKNFLELIKSIRNTYQMGISEEKRDIIKIITSNLQAHGKKLLFSIKSPFYEIANRQFISLCELDRSIPRTCMAKVSKRNKLPPLDVENPKFKKSMEELLKYILDFFEEEVKSNPDEDYED